MIKKIFDRYYKHPNEASGEDSLVVIILLAEENSDFRQTIVNILSLEPTQRELAITKIVDEMRKKDEPEDIVAALSALFHDHLANKILAHLKAE